MTKNVWLVPRTGQKMLFVANILLLIILPFGISASAKDDPFNISVSTTQQEIRAGESFDLKFVIKIAPGHFVYKDKTRLEFGPIGGFIFGSTLLPEAHVKYDKFLETEVEIYKDIIRLPSKVSVSEDVTPGRYEARPTVHYQGCSEVTCFLPQRKEFVITVTVLPPSGTGSTGNKPVNATGAADINSSSTSFEKTMAERGIFGALALAFLAGIGLSFTPCIYPIIPITVAIIGGQSARKPFRGFYLSLLYVLGIAIVYSALGVGAASTGALFGSAVNSPWVVGFVAAIFVAFALSMFGVYELRFPTSIAERFGSPKKGGGAIGIFFMGLVSGSVVSPCVGPVLVSLLVYIASTGNKMLGFCLLFTLAWGMGLLLIAVGTFSGALNALPKSGAWMVIIKKIFGLLMFGAALYYLKAIIPNMIFTIILGVFLITVGIFSGGLDRLVTESAVMLRIKKSFGILCLIFGAYFLVVALISNGLILSPLRLTQTTPGNDATHKESATNGQKIEWIPSEEEGLKMAISTDKPAMIDFWAEWCSVCKKMDKKTFSDAYVMEESRRFVNIKVDCTNVDDPEVKELWSKYGIVGLPTTIFVDRNGNILRNKTVNGFLDPREFVRIMKSM